MKVGFATYKDMPVQYGESSYKSHSHPHLTRSDERVLIYLNERGIDCQPLIWDGEETSLASFDLILIRSTWNYYHCAENIDKFLTFLSSIKDKVYNPSKAIEWNVNKSYLADLARAGLPIAPTLFVETRSGIKLTDVERVRNGDASVVIKPAISGDGRNAVKLNEATICADLEHVNKLYSDNKIEEALIQPYLSCASEQGEISLIFFRNGFSHAVRRKSSPDDFANPSNVFSLTSVPSEALELAQKALVETCKILNLSLDALLYSRIDLLPDGNGGFFLSEVELIEPELFLQHTESGVEAFGKAILSLVEERNCSVHQTTAHG